MRRGLVALLTALSAAADLCAAVTLGGPFTDGAVLQRDRPVRVWGTAEPGERVNVSFGGRDVSCTADAKGAWRCELPAFAASKEPRTLVARAASGEAKADDVLVGEVWIAAGQSNMEFPLWLPGSIRLRDRTGALTAQMTDKPCIRYAKMLDHKFSPKPVRNRKAEWKKFTPDNLLTGYVPAVGVYFALELYAALDVPIGWFACDWGGTMIEPWIPAEGFAAVPALADLAAVRPKTKTIMTDRAYEDRSNQQPTVLWNQQVASLTPYGVKGMIWYQGESNCRNAARYKDLLDGLYAGWSRAFENPDFKLYLVQIAPYNYGDGGVKSNKVREMEQAFADANPNAEIAIINDVGDLTEIHPHEKHTVGKRLAAFALANDYGFTRVKPRAPTLAKAEAKDGKLVLTFRDAEGLYAYDEAVGFELAGADGAWYDAVPDGKKGKRGQAFKNGTIVLSAKEVKEPRHVRYLAKSPWQGHVFNGSTIPLGTFHYDLPGTEGDLVKEVADVYYVSPSGDDAAVGTCLFQPLRTFQAAVERVRKLRAAGKIPADKLIRIESAGGDYVLDRPIVLTPEDSNLRLYGAERPGACVLRGGVELPPFREERPGLWSCDVPQGVRFEHLYVNARRVARADGADACPAKGWRIDTRASKLLYVPDKGETVDGVTAWVPQQGTLLEIRGDRAAGKVVRNVTVEGIQFEYAASDRPAAVVVTDAEKVKFGNCEFNHLGASALQLAAGVRQAEVVHCVFEDLGGGGISLGTSTAADGDCRGVTVDNCVIRQGGCEQCGAAGVFVGTASDCKLTHNYIHHLSGPGISACANGAEAAAKRNLIAQNDIHDVVGGDAFEKVDDGKPTGLYDDHRYWGSGPNFWLKHFGR